MIRRQAELANLMSNAKPSKMLHSRGAFRATFRMPTRHLFRVEYDRLNSMEIKEQSERQTDRSAAYDGDGYARCAVDHLMNLLIEVIVAL